MARADRFEPFDNLIIEETSMVDLFQLALIFRAIEVHQPTVTKRVILVGDENQLPPIGCGKPLQDILGHLRGEPALEAANHVRLIANCRQQHDTKVLDAAHLFAGRNRYQSELFDAMCQGGEISPFLEVRYYGSTEELHAVIDAFIVRVLDEAVPGHADMPREQAFNLLLNLFENGSVRGFESDTLALDRAQLLSPYRGGPSGALGLGTYVRDIWRADVREQPRARPMVFIIQTSWCESPTCTFGIIPPELANYGCLTAQSECSRAPPRRVGKASSQKARGRSTGTGCRKKISNSPMR